MLKIVGISEMCISDDPDDIIVTYSLGSCLGVAVYDHVLKIGGIVHCMLPLSQIDPEKAAQKPFMFTDTGISAILQEFFDRGSQRSNLVIKVAGAASLLDEKGFFKIGERNYTVLRKILWKNNILINAEAVKGNESRTVFLHIDSGRTIIKSSGREFELT